MKVELDKNDFEFIFQSICHFDFDVEYDEWFGKENADKMYDSFNYLYSVSQEYRK